MENVGEIINALSAAEAFIISLAVVIVTIAASIIKILNVIRALDTTTGGIQTTHSIDAMEWIERQEPHISLGAIKALHKSVARAKKMDEPIRKKIEEGEANKIARKAASDRLR